MEVPRKLIPTKINGAMSLYHEILKPSRCLILYRLVPYKQIRNPLLQVYFQQKNYLLHKPKYPNQTLVALDLPCAYDLHFFPEHLLFFLQEELA